MNKRALRWICLILVFGVLIIALYRQLGSPSEGEFKTGRSDKLESSMSERRYLKHTGNNISFEYPEGFVLKQTHDPEGPILESVVYNSQSGGFKSLVVVISESPGLRLHEESGVAARLLKPADYSIENKSVRGLTWMIFTRKAGYPEKTAFAKIEDFAVSVSVTSPSSTEDSINEIFLKVLETFRLEN